MARAETLRERGRPEKERAPKMAFIVAGGSERRIKFLEYALSPHAVTARSGGNEEDIEEVGKIAEAKVNFVLSTPLPHELMGQGRRIGVIGTDIRTRTLTLLSTDSQIAYLHSRRKPQNP